MDEIELLREVRAELPAARAESRAAARGGLMARIEHSRPAGLRVPFWRRPRLRLAVAGIALAALLVALPIGILGGGGEAQPAVAQVLHDAATVAAAQDPVMPGPGQYLYTRSENAYLNVSPYLPASERHPCTAQNSCDMTGADEWSVLVPKVRESWISLDGSRQGRLREVSGKPRFVSPGQRANWVAAGSPPLPQPGQIEDSALSGGGGQFDATGLPTDPVALRRLIEARKIPGLEGPPGEAETFSLIGEMLRETYLPAAVRAALYELTAELPGVELLGEVEDSVGRPGIGIAYTDHKTGTRNELIFDPATSTLLGERDSLVRSGMYGFTAPPGTPIGYAAYLESRVVDSVGQGAPAGAGGVDNTVACYDRPSLSGNVAVVHGPDPIATCAEVWQEGAMDTRHGPSSPHLVACASERDAGAVVFPATDPAVCHRLGLAPFPPREVSG